MTDLAPDQLQQLVAYQNGSIIEQGGQILATTQIVDSSTNEMDTTAM